MYFIPEKVQGSFAQDVDPAEANILAVVQQSFNRLLLRNQALRLGSSFQHDIRSLRMIVLLLLISSGNTQKG